MIKNKLIDIIKYNTRNKLIATFVLIVIVLIALLIKTSFYKSETPVASNPEVTPVLTETPTPQAATSTPTPTATPTKKKDTTPPNTTIKVIPQSNKKASTYVEIDFSKVPKIQTEYDSTHPAPPSTAISAPLRNAPPPANFYSYVSPPTDNLVDPSK